MSSIWRCRVTDDVESPTMSSHRRCQYLFYIRQNDHEVFVPWKLRCLIRVPGPLQWQRASSSRAGWTQVPPEICILIHVCRLFRLGCFLTRIIFHWFPCSGPSRVFLFPPWRPPRTISTNSPEFEFRYQDLMPFIYGQRFCCWDYIYKLRLMESGRYLKTNKMQKHASGTLSEYII
jgi:hypothetical protein